MNPERRCSNDLTRCPSNHCWMSLWAPVERIRRGFPWNRNNASAWDTPRLSSTMSSVSESESNHGAEWLHSWVGFSLRAHSVFQRKGSGRSCIPRRFRWTPHVMSRWALCSASLFHIQGWDSSRGREGSRRLQVFLLLLPRRSTCAQHEESVGNCVVNCLLYRQWNLQQNSLLNGFSTNRQSTLAKTTLVVFHATNHSHASSTTIRPKKWPYFWQQMCWCPLACAVKSTEREDNATHSLCLLLPQLLLTLHNHIATLWKGLKTLFANGYARGQHLLLPSLLLMVVRMVQWSFSTRRKTS